MACTYTIFLIEVPDPYPPSNGRQISVASGLSVPTVTYIIQTFAVFDTFRRDSIILNPLNLVQSGKS